MQGQVGKLVDQRQLRLYRIGFGFQLIGPVLHAAGDIQGLDLFLKEQGLSQIAKRSGREAGQGVIEPYIHGEGRIGVLVELNCETDFVARTPDFKQLAHDIAMQVAATNPPRVGNEEGSENTEDDPENLPLLKQPFIKDPGKTVADLIRDVAATTRENVVLKRFIRFEPGA